MNCTERPWGTYEVLLDADDCKVKRITVRPGENPSYQMHYKRSEKWVVVSGSGKVRIDFYDEKKDYLISKILYKGDVILLITGGHGFEMLEQSEMIEIKQGPYHNGDADKTRFKSINKDKIKIE